MKLGNRVDELGVISALVVLVLVIGAFHPSFLEWAQLVDVVEQALSSASSPVA